MWDCLANTDWIRGYDLCLSHRAVVLERKRFCLCLPALTARNASTTGPVHDGGAGGSVFVLKKTLLEFNQDKAEARSISKNQEPKRRKYHALFLMALAMFAAYRGLLLDALADVFVGGP